MAEDLKALSIEQLAARLEAIGEKKAVLIAEARLLKAELNSKLLTQGVLAKLGNLKPDEADAVLALLRSDPDKVQALIAESRRQRGVQVAVANAADIGIVSDAPKKSG